MFDVPIGDLRTWITFQAPTLSEDGGGAQKATFATVASNPTVRARVVYDHGSEAVANNAAQAVQRATVTVRYRSDVLATWQVLLHSQPWKLISPPENVQERNHWLVFRIERSVGSA
jgi:head-tail adaptor